MAYDLIFHRTKHNWARDLIPSASSLTDSSIGRETRAQRRARRLLHIQQLKARAAAGDPRAIAKLQRMQADLGLPVTATPASVPLPVPTSIPLPVPTYPTQPSYATPAYQPSYQPQYAYQSPYYDESLSQDPYGPPPPPPIDVYQGEEEQELARDGGSAERAALTRTGRA